MTTAYRSLTTLAITLFSFCTALAQTQPPPAPVVTASASSDRVRYASLGEVQQTRLQVFSGDGAQVFDSDFRLGNLVTWRLADQRGTRLPDGSYLFLVTVKDFNGNLTQKYGASVLERGQVYLEQAARDELSAAQATALEANRLTEAATPVDRLGVAAWGGAEGAGEAAAAESALGATSTQGSKTGKSSTQATTTPSDVSGAGTTGRLVKWTDGAAGALGDSILTESGGRIGLATATPRATLDIKQSADSFLGGLHLRRSTTSDTWALVTGGDNNLYMGFANNASGADEAGDFRVYPLVLTPNNRVGIGTTAPAAKLHVAGDVNFTGLRTQATAAAPNVIGGAGDNYVSADVVGAVIGGGGGNGVTDTYGVVGGGASNRAGDASPSTFARFATIGGGLSNIASGSHSTIGGGSTNIASGHASTVPGGSENTASGKWSFAAGFRANAFHLGSFVWSDSTAGISSQFFSSTGDNQFLINATGGVGIGTNSPGAARLKVQGGDVYIASPSSLVITSPDGSCWRIRVSNAGALSAASVACP